MEECLQNVCRMFTECMECLQNALWKMFAEFLDNDRHRFGGMTAVGLDFSLDMSTS